MLFIPREGEDFPRGDKHFKHVPRPTYLICLSPKDFIQVSSIQALQSPEFVNNLLPTGFEPLLWKAQHVDSILF